jgi:nucleoside-diphosphate-sugar epimerase
VDARLLRARSRRSGAPDGRVRHVAADLFRPPCGRRPSPGRPGRRSTSPTATSSKARRYGFHSYVETEEMLLRLIEDLRKRRIIPG